MHTYPLIKTRLSNARVMTALVLVLLLYNLPRLLAEPGSIPPLLLLIVIGLLIDAVAHYVLYKRPVCAVSAAVTALVLYTLSPGTPFWPECAALAVSLIVGKVIWGGTGKNPLNPAMLGLALLALLTHLRHPAFNASLLLVPAIILSLPFSLIRPYAGLGMMLGMAASLLLRHDLTVQAVLANGIFFWGCLVITDPVTTTSKPLAGLVIGLLTGFVPGAAGHLAAENATVMPVAVLISNFLSYLADQLGIGGTEKLKKTFFRSQKIIQSADSPACINLTGENSAKYTDAIPACEEIIRRVEKAGVFGMGGAAFPTAEKLRTVLASAAPEKHFIINAAECDPGLVHDKWLLNNRSGDIMKGIEILQKCVSFKTVTLASKYLSPVRFPAPVRSFVVNDFYPAGAEKILIRDVLQTAPERVSAEDGILVLNVQTVIAVGEAVLSARAADTRYLTAADLDKKTGKVVRVKLGSRVSDTVGKVLRHAAAVYTGGGIMNARLADDDAVIDEKTNFLAVGLVNPFREALCSRCDFCSAYCPAHLRVREIAQLVDENKLEKAVQLQPENCIECALCSFVCLAGRDQAKRVKTAKNRAADK